ncbi:hypothetical protein V3C99_011379 [Haemonchus contortus]
MARTASNCYSPSKPRPRLKHHFIKQLLWKEAVRFPEVLITSEMTFLRQSLISPFATFLILVQNNLSPPQPSASFRNAGDSVFFENTADVSMENQPLPTGFYISTAPAADVPDWFWAIYSGAKNRTPVHLKSSLH